MREARERGGLSQTQLAGNSGLSARAVRELEAGRSSPSLATIVAIADALSITLDELIAAARAQRQAFGLLTAAGLSAGAGPYDRELITAIAQPRLRVRVIDAGPNDPIVLPAGSAFAHVLGGAMKAVLDEEHAMLSQGDCFHSRTGVLTAMMPSAGGVRVLLVEAPGT